MEIIATAETELRQLLIRSLSADGVFRRTSMIDTRRIRRGTSGKGLNGIAPLPAEISDPLPTLAGRFDLIRHALGE